MTPPLPPIRERVSQRARQLRIEVRPGGEVWLIIPRGMSRETARTFVSERADWIRHQSTRLREYAVPLDVPLRWDGSDQISLHGIPRPLRLINHTMRTVRVRWSDEEIAVFAPRGTAHEVLETRLQLSLRNHARHQAEQMLAEEAARLNVTYTGPRIADQKTLWGSCSGTGMISLNWRLVMAPPAVFRYVIVHELCHRRHHDHSRRFWALVARQMPDFKNHRDWLRQHGLGLKTWF